MTSDIDLDRLDLLILARLCPSRKKPLSRGELGTEMARYLPSRVTASQLHELCSARVASLRSAGLLDSNRLCPTEAGRARVCDAIGARSLPPRWLPLRNKLVAAISAGSEPGASRERLKKPDRLRARILKETYELPVAAAPTITQAIDALVWKQLGLESSEPLSLSKIRAHFLHQVLGTSSRLPPQKLAKVLAARSVDASSGESEHLRTALLRRWLASSRSTSSAANDRPGQPSRPTTLPAFAEIVAKAAHTETKARFGDRKVFISALWRALRAHPKLASMSEDEFKARLVEANRAGLLTLHRADLVSAMDPGEIEASETRYMNATFHFVEIDNTAGMAAANLAGKGGQA